MAFLDGSGGKPPLSWTLGPNAFATNVFATNVVDQKELFYHDLPEKEDKEWFGKLEKQAQGVFWRAGSTLMPAGWMSRAGIF